MRVVPAARRGRRPSRCMSAQRTPSWRARTAAARRGPRCVAARCRPGRALRRRACRCVELRLLVVESVTERFDAAGVVMPLVGHAVADSGWPSTKLPEPSALPIRSSIALAVRTLVEQHCAAPRRGVASSSFFCVLSTWIDNRNEATAQPLGVGLCLGEAVVGAASWPANCWIEAWSSWRWLWIALQLFLGSFDLGGVLRLASSGCRRACRSAGPGRVRRRAP